MPRTRKSKVEEAIDQAVPEVEAAPETPKQPEPPEMTDPLWSEYVLIHFSERELIDDCPTNAGLRRVTSLLLGPIIQETPHTIQAPNANNGYFATEEATIRIAWGGDKEDIRTFGDVADVYTGNTDAIYARHASSSAFTKASSRAFKKALMLVGVLAAEEKTSVPVAESGLNGLIVLSQQRGIEKLCREAGDEGIDVMKYINSWPNRNYSRIDQVRYDDAQKFLEHLNELRNDHERIPDSIKGFDPDWRKKTQ